MIKPCARPISDRGSAQSCGAKVAAACGSLIARGPGSGRRFGEHAGHISSRGADRRSLMFIMAATEILARFNS